MTSTPYCYPKNVLDESQNDVIVVDELHSHAQHSDPTVSNSDHSAKRLSWKKEVSGITKQHAPRHKNSEFIDSKNFAEFVSTSIIPLSLTTPNQEEVCLKKYERVCLPLLDSRRKVVYVWCEEDQNALLREGILREQKMQLQGEIGHARHPNDDGYIERRNTISTISLPDSLDGLDHAQRRSSCGTIQTALTSCNNRRHSISYLPHRAHAHTPISAVENTEFEFDKLFCTDSINTPPYTLTQSSTIQYNPTEKPPKHHKRARESDEPAEDEKVLVFDGVVRRKKGNVKPQDSFQIKFKLV